MFKLFMFFGVMWAIWQWKHYALLIIIMLLGGCAAVETTCHYDAWGDHHCTKVYHFDNHSHTETQTVVLVEKEKPPEETIIYIESNEQSLSCNDLYFYTVPHTHLAYQCYYYTNGDEECDWYAGMGCYESWYWDSYTCEWYYMYDYCL